MRSVLRTRLVHQVSDISAAAWNSLGVDGYPFLRHEFLLALEQRGCLGRSVGWFPSHLVCEDDSGGLLGALPMYLKANSFGEFVFDWSWAEAHEKSGRDYYPKLVVASPFTPATGPRVLVGPAGPRETIANTLIDGALGIAAELRISSVHWLFGTDTELDAAPRLLTRKGCQFHWENCAFRDFEDFLERLTSKRRKEIRRERRKVEEAGLAIERIHGHEADDADWRFFHRLYRSTFARHGNFPALRLDFFREIGERLGEKVLLVVASKAGEGVAAAFFLVGSDTLYGRYWGALDEIPALHFELCYYQGIEYCIEKSLRRFEPGAQGEHKVSRGFEPTATWSYHWIADPDLRNAIANFLQRETIEVDRYIRSLSQHSAYRDSSSC
jgi:uncharacterized protein